MPGVDLDGVLDQIALDVFQGPEVSTLVENADRAVRQGRQFKTGGARSGQVLRTVGLALALGR